MQKNERFYTINIDMYKFMSFVTQKYE